VFLGLPDPAWEGLSYVGFVLLLGAFALHLAGRLPREGLAYPAANALGSAILALYSAKLGSPALTALEAAWCAIALGGWALPRLRRRAAA
jgi:hypothetical protein